MRYLLAGSTFLLLFSVMTNIPIFPKGKTIASDKSQEIKGRMMELGDILKKPQVPNDKDSVMQIMY